MQDAVELSIRQFTEAWNVLCADAPGRAFSADEGVEYVFSGLPIGFFNVALVTARGVSSEALTSIGQRACTWASDKGVPWLFVLTHEALDAQVDAAGVLEGCGLAPMMRLTGMHAQQVAPLASSPEGLQLTVAEDDGACASILDVNAAAYGMDLEAAKTIMGPSFWRDHVPVLGLADGQPASCAAVLMADGHRYVALVATNPGQQRRGYAEAAMRRALEVASQRHGERPTVLHATDAGRPIYARMGYTTISTHTIFMEKRFLAGH